MDYEAELAEALRDPETDSWFSILHAMIDWIIDTKTLTVAERQYYMDVWFGI